MNRPKVYLAGAITGLTFDESEDWRKVAKIKLRDLGIAGYSPLRQKEYLANQGELYGAYGFHPLSTARGIMTRDFNDVKTSDIVLANLWGAAVVSVGTCMEMGWCWQMQKPLVVISEPDNIHLTHPFVQECVSYRVDTLDEGIYVVASILFP